MKDVGARIIDPSAAAVVSASHCPCLIRDYPDQGCYRCEGGRGIVILWGHPIDDKARPRVWDSGVAVDIPNSEHVPRYANYGHYRVISIPGLSGSFVKTLGLGSLCSAIKPPLLEYERYIGLQT